MEDNTKKLYETLSLNGYEDIGNYKDFEGKLKDSGKREILYGKLKEDGFEDIGSLSDFNAKLGYSDIDTTDQGSRKGFWNTYLGDAIEKLNAGGAQLGAGLFGALDKATSGIEKLGLGTRGGMFKDASGYFKGVAETSRVNSDRYNGKSYSHLWKEGDYAGAIGDIALQGIESLPVSISAAAATIAGAPVAGLAGIGAITASDKYDQLDAENPNMGEFAKASNAIITGTAEGLSEMLGAGVSKAWMKTLYKSLGRDKAEQAVKKGLMGQLQRHYKEFGMFYEPVEEGIEEVASQLAENITDKVTGADPNRDITDGLKDSFVYGMGGGAYFSAAGAPGFAKRQYDKIKTRRDYNNAKEVFYSEFKGDNKMLGIGNELEAATPEEKSAFLEALDSSNQFSQEQKDALFNLVQSDIAYKSLRTPEAINEEKNERRELSIQTEMMNYDNAIAPITAENGMIQQVYINGDKDNPVYITKGNIAVSQNESGEILFNADNSDQSLYYRDTEGKMQVITPNQVSGIASVMSAADSRAQYEANLRTEFDMQDQMAEQQRRQEEAQEISNGDDVTYIDPDTGKQIKGKVGDLKPGSEDVSIDIGDGILSTVPKSIVVKSAIQTESAEGGVESEMIDKTSEKSPVNEVVSPDKESKMSEIANSEPVPADVVEVQEQEAEPVLPVTEKSPIVMREDGTPDFIASGEENTLDFLFEKYKDKLPYKVEVTKNALESDLKKASAKLDKAQQNYDNSPIGKEDKAESALLQAQQTHDTLKQEADFWINLDKTIKEANEKSGDVIAKEIEAIGEPVNGEELAAKMLANGSIRLTRESYKKETGAGNTETSKMFGLFASPEKGGVNIERAGELVMLADLEAGTNLFDQNDPNAGRNAIIEVLSSSRTRGDLINYIKTNREVMAERERQAVYNEYVAWCEENYHMSPEDYGAYEEDMRKQIEFVTDETIEYVSGEIADEIRDIKEEQEEIDAILAQNNNRTNEKNKRNDEGGTGGLREGSDQLLQGEQSVQTGRIGEPETKHTGTDDSINLSDGVVQESPVEKSKLIEGEEFSDDDNTSSIQEAILEAEQQVDTNPTDAQKEAGNYKKGHVKIDGFDITIEQPTGSIRSGKDADGKEWSVIMNNTYGYIRGTEGVDGDHIDIFLSDSPASGNIYVVDQVNADESFDEHKVMYGFNSTEDAKAAYLSNYSPGWKGLGNITEVSKGKFKEWIDSSTRKTKPFADYKIANKTKKEDTEIRFRKSTTVSEEESIIERSKADGMYMKAPNGKPTNLNEKQWVQVRSKAFKKWFGDWENDPQKSSKVLDKNGEPLVVYHGTLTNGLTKFKKEFVGSRYSYDEKGFFFINSEKIARDYAVSEYDSTRKGEVVSVFINLRNPLVADVKWCKKNGLGGRVFEDNDVIEFWDNYQSLMIEESENKDGVIVSDGKYTMTVAFEPNQIKSATDNNGNYSLFDDDIRFRTTEGSGTNTGIDDVNQKFNNELQQQLDGTLPKGHIYQLGKPSAVLQAAGIPDLPIELRSDKLAIKASEKYKSNHPFEFGSVVNLPQAIANPIAVFNSNSSYGSKVILTELKDNKGNSFIVSLSTNVPRGFNRISVNSITSVYPKDDVKGIIGWVNRGDRLKYAEKNKFSSWIAQQMPHATDLAISTRELNVATNIVGSFVNPTLDEGKITSSVEKLSETLNTPVHIIKDVNEIADDDLKQQRQKRGSKGWYDPVTNEVYLVLPNAESVADAQSTTLHEVVAHKGLRSMLGDNFTSTMDSVYESLPKEVQDSLMNEFGDKTVSGEEYCAHMAETMSDPGIIQKISSIIKDVFRSMGVDLKMSDGDIMYMLWKSKNRLKESDTAFDVMKKTKADNAVRENIKEYDTLFRSKKPFDELRMSPEKKAELKGNIQSRIELLHEAYVDRMIAVKKLQDIFEKKTGKPIPDYMNVYLYENTLSPRNTYEQEQFKAKLVDPMVEAVERLTKKGITQRDIENYVMAKHGLERNEKMRYDELADAIDAIKDDELRDRLKSEIDSKKFSELSVLSDEKFEDMKQSLSGKDFSGLTAIQKELGEVSIGDFITDTESKYKTEIKNLWNKIHAVNDFSLKKSFDSGMINRETYDKIKGMYEYYIPLRGFDEAVAHDVYDYYSDSEIPYNDPIKTAKGRTSRADDPLAYMMSMGNSVIVGGNKNQMKLHLYRLAQSGDIEGLSVSKQWYAYMGIDKDGVEIWEPSYPDFDDDPEQYRKNIENHEADMIRLQSEGKAKPRKGKLKIDLKTSQKEQEEHLVKVKLNGEEHIVYVHGNPKVAQAINGLNSPERNLSKFVKGMEWANRQMAANFTTRNPAFVFSNLSRDLIWSTTTLGVKEGGKYQRRFLRNVSKASKALFGRIKAGENWQVDQNDPISVMLDEFLKNGGRTGYTALYSIDKYKEQIENSLATGKWAKTKRGYNAVLDFMQLPNEWAEDLSRFATYMTSRQEGRSILQSVSNAKEVTINFNRKGSGAMGNSTFKSFFLFFNAAVQSLNNAFNMCMRNKAGTAKLLGGFAVAGMVIPSILSLLGDDDDREKYMGLPDYVRKNNLCIPLGFIGMDGFLKIPLPIELRAFYGIGDAALRYACGYDEGTEATGDVVLGLLDLLPLNPVGGSSVYVPSALQPVVESYITNKDFTGKPIAKITPFNEYDPEYQRIYKSTSVIPIKISEYLNILTGGDEAKRGWYDKLLGSSPTAVNLSNPAAVEHLFEAYLGGMFTFMNQSFKTVIGIPTGINDFSWRNVPVLNRFYDTGEVDGTMMKVNEKFYKYLDEMKEAEHAYRKYKRLIDNSPSLQSAKYIQKLEEFENSDEWKKAEFIKSFYDEISDLNDEIRETTDEEYLKRLKEEVAVKKKEMVDSLKNGRVPE
ncbi:ADP-ribosyltransferase-containing protein [Parabacteroides provencensis]|uniref:ADP-ribosyltransferase-containing protein n=1 Tax=Parabacteroides provencensis TaxID=1944636 RepID=UPI000C1501DF|nr:LPD38 domain-containing protein [Parabacteroides provencensis]